jgi:TATA-box binding protein (TBP) (component of TFIID and TFIIIB)
MSQSVKEFVRQSGVELQAPDSASNSNNNFARELDFELERSDRDRAAREAREAREASAMRGSQFFRTPSRPIPRQSQFPPRLQRNIVNNRTYGRFKQFENSNNDSPMSNEFDDVILNSKNEKMINNLLAEQRFSDNTEINTRDNFFNQNIAPPPTNGLQVSKLNPGMFNAMVNKEFGNTPRLDLKAMLVKRPLGKTSAGEGLYIDTTEIRGKYGQFKQGFSHTKEAGPQGDLNKAFSTVQFGLQISNNVESKGATVSFFRNGKIRFSGGFVGANITNQPELIRRFVVDNYTDKQPFLYSDFEYNNLSGQFKVNGIFKNMANIAREKQQYGMSYATYEPELTPFLYIESTEHKFIITRNGNVQISGAKSPQDLENAYRVGTEFVKKLNRDGEIDITGVFNNSLKQGKTKAKPKAKAKAKKVIKRSNLNKFNKLTKNQINAIKIDDKMLKNFDKAELIDFARKMGITNFRSKDEKTGFQRDSTKNQIRSKIKEKYGIRTIKYKNTNKGQNVALTGNNVRFRIGKELCKNMKVKELLRIASVMKISLTGKEKKADLCKLIEKARNSIANKPVVKPLSPRALKQKVKNNKRNTKEISKNFNRQMKINNTEIKRRLNENSIRNDLGKLYGSKWMNRYKPNLTQDVKTIQNKIRNISNANKNKMGVPFKREIDTIKKHMVSNWKMQRKRDLEKKYLNNKLNVNGVNANLKNAYRRAAVNYMMNLTNAKKKIDAEKMNRYKKRWLKTRANANNNARPKVGAKARINKM